MLQAKQKESILTIRLDGEIDHHASETMREEIERLIRLGNPDTLILDFEDVSFMDSSGVGMIIGRYKTMTARKGIVYAAGLHPPVERLFRMAGLHRIIEVIKGERRDGA